jgi:hypothetical protein
MIFSENRFTLFRIMPSLCRLREMRPALTPPDRSDNQYDDRAKHGARDLAVAAYEQRRNAQQRQHGVQFDADRALENTLQPRMHRRIG